MCVCVSVLHKWAYSLRMFYNTNPAQYEQNRYIYKHTHTHKHTLVLTWWRPHDVLGLQQVVIGEHTLQQAMWSGGVMWWRQRISNKHALSGCAVYVFIHTCCSAHVFLKTDVSTHIFLSLSLFLSLSRALPVIFDLRVRAAVSSQINTDEELN